MDQQFALPTTLGMSTHKWVTEAGVDSPPRVLLDEIGPDSVENELALREPTTAIALELKRTALELERTALGPGRIALELVEVALERTVLKLERTVLKFMGIALELLKVALELAMG